MDVILKRKDGIISIDGIEWRTRESFLAFNKIKKSNFYNKLHEGIILSEQLFLDKNTVFYVYRMKEASI
jgi:hypothetical protein